MIVAFKVRLELLPSRCLAVVISVRTAQKQMWVNSTHATVLDECLENVTLPKENTCPHEVVRASELE